MFEICIPLTVYKVVMLSGLSCTVTCAGRFENVGDGTEIRTIVFKSSVDVGTGGSQFERNALQYALKLHATSFVLFDIFYCKKSGFTYICTHGPSWRSHRTLLIRSNHR